MDAPIDQPVLGSRRISNYLVALLVSIGGVGFLLTSASSYFGRDFLPIGHPAELIWVPQGLVMGAYGVGAVLLSSYLWAVIASMWVAAATCLIAVPTRSRLSAGAFAA